LADVELLSVSKVYPNGVAAVAGVGLCVGDGELLALVGPSGSGKSTLLRLVAGLEPPTAGSVRIGGREVTGLPPRGRDVAMVFQDPALYPHLSVFDNLAFGLRARGMGRSEVAARVDSVATPLGLSGLLDRRPQTLSGGQRRRVALGRALARRAAVFLLDEPLSGLDAPLRAAIRNDLIDLRRRLGLTMIYVTHDPGEALAMGDRVAVIEQGRLVQVGPPREVYGWPASRFVATFLGDPPASLVSCRVSPQGDSVRLKPDRTDVEVLLAIPEGCSPSGLAAAAGGDLEMGVRPEAVVFGPSADALAAGFAPLSVPCEVVRFEYLGHETIVTLDLAGCPVKARGRSDVRFEPGDRVAVGLALDRVSWFHAATGLAIGPTNVGRVEGSRIADGRGTG
jgi:ABC-type sugar transport system ATPase subunit